MNRIMKTNILILSVIFAFGIVNAQKTPKEIKGDKYFSNFAFTSAIEKYTAVDNLTSEGQRKLAESYKNTNQIESSSEVYASFIEGPNVTSEDYFNYASVLRLEGKYKESDLWMKKFQSKSPNDSRANNFVENAARLNDIQIDKGRHKIIELEVNSEQQDFSPAYYGENQVVFASSREGVKSIKRSYSWNNLPFLDMYSATIDSTRLIEPIKLSNKKKLNDRMHEGPASFNKAGDFMAFTRNNYEGESEDGAIKLKIFFAKKIDEEWKEVVPFKLNSSEYSVGHPSLTADGNTMYFSSDMPGGKGGVDIYRIKKNDSGEWGTAVNLGSEVNTAGNEVFPFYQESKRALFFASNGHLGLGGLDLFVSKEQANGEYKQVINVGAPLNTKSDDFGLIINNEMKEGYFSSNRIGGKGDDDIYAFELLKPYKFSKYVFGKVTDEDGNPISEALVKVVDKNGKFIFKKITSENGNFDFDFDEDVDFDIIVNKDKYVPLEKKLSSDDKELLGGLKLVLEKESENTLFGEVKDLEGNLLSNAEVSVYNKEGKFLFKHLTGENGAFKFEMDDNEDYNIIVNKSGYLSSERAVSKEASKRDIDFSLEKGSNTDASVMLVINAINFDLDQSAIRSDAKVELDKIVELMNKYPAMKIELGSHTDCRATKAYNKRLSDRRAKASAKYIKSKISNPGRIYGKGYGEERLLNGCACEGDVESTCSEKEHERNRRTEFRIISLGDSNFKVKNNSPQSFDK